MPDAPKAPAVYIRTFPRPDFGVVNRLRNRFSPFYAAQDGFFRASLHAAFRVSEISLADAAGRNFDAPLFLNWKSLPSGQIVEASDLTFLKNLNGPKILVCTNARPQDMPADELCDLFDIVFKREPYLDRDRYTLSFHNKMKLRTTMLSCPLVPAPRWADMARFDASKYGASSPPPRYEYDVFFAGAATNQHRVDIAQALHDRQDIHSFLSLQSRSQASVEGMPFEGARMSKRDYARLSRASKVNLALEGIGPFTYRHLELLALSGFFLSTPKIKELELPITLADGRDYVAYENADDLADKALYYASHDNERQAIAASGRAAFVRDYNFKKHGEYIASVLKRT